MAFSRQYHLFPCQPGFWWLIQQNIPISLKLSLDHFIVFYFLLSPVLYFCLFYFLPIYNSCILSNIVTFKSLCQPVYLSLPIAIVFALLQLSSLTSCGKSSAIYPYLERQSNKTESTAERGGSQQQGKSGPMEMYKNYII